MNIYKENKMTTTKTIANKVVKALNEINERGLFRIVEKDDQFLSQGGFMIQVAKDLEDVSNPMDALVNFDVDSTGCNALLTWKETGKKLTEEEYRNYFDSCVWTKKSADKIKYEDFIFIYKDKNSINVSGSGFSGAYLTSMDEDYSRAEYLEDALIKLLPNKEVYIDGYHIGIWEQA